VRATEFAELAAMVDLFAAAPQEARAESARAGEALAMRLPTMPRVRELNRIVGLSSLRELDALEPLYGEGHVLVSLDPETGLDAPLEGRGYDRGYPWHKFVRGVEPYDATSSLSVQEARAPLDFGRAFADGYGLPEPAASWLARLVGRAGWHCFVGYADDEPVAAGVLYVAGETGWLGMGATLPAARGRGGQSAILAARIARARELGLRELVTETGAPREDGPGSSYRNILRAGFELAYERPNYVRERAS
jgi:GNAT superfamily N-acetyltransferase